MHHKLYEQLRLKTFLLQFYGFLTRGFFEIEERTEMHNLIENNIDRLNLMKDFNWDGRYDLVASQLFKTEELVKKTTEKLRFNQSCADIDIANYLINNHNNFFEFGIQLNDLKRLLEIDILFRNGVNFFNLIDNYLVVSSSIWF